jgi:hypothetical protein
VQGIAVSWSSLFTNNEFTRSCQRETQEGDELNGTMQEGLTFLSILSVDTFYICVIQSMNISSSIWLIRMIIILTRAIKVSSESCETGFQIVVFVPRGLGLVSPPAGLLSFFENLPGAAAGRNGQKPGPARSALCRASPELGGLIMERTNQKPGPAGADQ